MPDSEVPTGIEPQVEDKLQVETEGQPAPEKKNPNEKLLPLAEFSMQIIGINQKLLEMELVDNSDRLVATSNDRVTQQMKELDALAVLMEKIKKGDKPFVPFDLKNAPIDNSRTTTIRLAIDKGKVKAEDRGGLDILTLQLVHAREGESNLDEAYSKGLRGLDSEKIVNPERTDPRFQPTALQTIYVSSTRAFYDGLWRSKIKAPGRLFTKL